MRKRRETSRDETLRTVGDDLTMRALAGSKLMHEDSNIHEPSGTILGQGIGVASDVNSSVMENVQNMPVVLGFAAPRPHDRRRTIVALVSASIISLVVWGLILALNLQ
jgi:hypothetical protein